MIGLVGKKVGMTRLFDDSGCSIPITIIEVKKNYVIQVRSLSNTYQSVQLTIGKKKKNKILKSEIGHFKKSGIPVGIGLWSFKTKKNVDFTLGQSLDVSLFNNIKKVDISGISKGKGFSGTVKRWNFSMQDATHGNSLSHRAPGSIGQNQTPGRVFKGKKMSGHLGNKKVTIQNLKIVQIDIDNNLIIVKGSVPGSIGGNMIIKPSIKL